MLDSVLATLREFLGTNGQGFGQAGTQVAALTSMVNSCPRKRGADAYLDFFRGAFTINIL